MTCNEIETRLPAYLEDLLSPEEQKSIREHLASCTSCSRAFSDLRKAERLVRDLEAVEPPPFFEQRIMSRIREEAGRKQGIIRKLFYPLHIKIPVQVLATLLVAVLAFYVYQTGDPELKRMASFPAPPAEHKQDQAQAESPKAVTPPSTVAPVKRPPAGDISEKGRQRSATPLSQNGAKEERMSHARVQLPEEGPSAAKSSDTLGPQSPDMARERAESTDAGRALEKRPPEQNRKERISDSGDPAGESRKAMLAPSPSRMRAAAAIREPVIDLTIQTGNAGVALREIETRLNRVDARIIESRRRGETGFLKAEIPAQNFAALLDLLEEIGDVNRETSPPAGDGNLTVNINIVRRP